MLRIVFLGLILLGFQMGRAQVILDTVSSPKELILKKLLGERNDLIVKNVRFTGKKYSLAGFKTLNPTGFIDNGILLTTGHVQDAQGPNESPNSGVRSNGAGDQDLQAIATGVTRDAAVLEFDFLALKDSVEFQYVFASEEYPEYVDKGVNDVFGFFIKEIDGRAIYPQNIAKLPDGRTVVSIDNVNHRRNEAYFLRSDYLQAHDAAFWEEHPHMMMRAFNFEFDGFTQILYAKARLRNGKWYHIKLAIADVGDRFYDSAVLLKANSMKALGKRIPQADSIVSLMIKEDLPEIAELEIEAEGQIKFSLRVNFNSNESEILPSSYAELKQLVNLLEKHPDVSLEIIGHTDNVGSDQSNQDLSLRRAKAVKQFLEKGNIEPGRMIFSGMGESKPIADNTTEQGRYQNRRVEFHFRY